MARAVKDSKLDSRHARDGCEPRARPYYTTLIPGELHLGYRIRRRKGRGAQGRWLVRRYLGKDALGVGRYQERDIGLADDFLDADGQTILNFKQAQQRANEWRRDNDGGQPQSNGPLTVAGALERYFAYLEDEGRPTRDARMRAALHIVPPLGREIVDTLSTERLRRWVADLAKQPPRVRQKVDAPAPRYKVMPAGDEARRRRRSTANRVLTILKSALNFAFDEGRATSNRAWGRRLKPFRNADAPRERHLSIAEAQRVINAAEPVEFRWLVQAALCTGARYGELTRLKVADFNVDAGTVAVWQSKSGKPRQIFLTDEGVTFFKQLTAGRAGDEIMLKKADGTAWQKSEQSRPMAAAVKRARVSPPISFHGLRHSFASLSAMAGMPLAVLAANLGHANDHMVQKHYQHLTPSFLRQEVRKNAPKFGFAKSKVTPLARGE